MKRGLGLAILSVLVISILLVSSVSAFSFNDFSNFFKNFWQRITGRVIENNPPSATLSANPTSGEAPLTVSFQVSCSDPDNDPGNYLAICSVEYGDNSAAPYISEGGKPVSKTIQHTYSSAGTYTVVLKAVDYKMLETKKEIIITVTKATTQPPVPIQTATASPSATASQLTCTDSDGKDNFNVAGSVSCNNGNAYEDFCKGTYAHDYYFSQGKVSYTRTDCATLNKICENGVCIKKGPTPIAYWKFDEAQGIIARDSADANDGTIKEASWTEGISNNALKFDGKSYVSVSDSNSLDLTNKLTVSLWVYPEKSGSYLQLVTKNKEAEKYSYYFSLNNLKPAVYLGGLNNPGWHETAEAIGLNQWSYVAFTFNGSDLKIYVNGVLKKTVSSLTGSININSQALWIGSRSDLASYNFIGKIDEVKIYNLDLTAEEIKQNYYEESKPLEGYLQIATIKNTYNVGEKVELTDPPEETSSGSDLTKSKLLALSREKVYNQILPSKDYLPENQIYDKIKKQTEIPKETQERLAKLDESAVSELAKLRDKTSKEKKMFEKYKKAYTDTKIRGLNIINPIAYIKRGQAKKAVELQKVKLTKAKLDLNSTLEKYGVPIEMDQELDEIEEKATTWTPNYNMISIQTDEYQKKLCGLKVSEEDVKEISTEKPELTETTGTDSSLPDFFDWRNQNGVDYITPIKDQGACGSCWAFAAVAALEGAINIYYARPDLDVDLSEQDLISCYLYNGCCGAYDEEIKNLFSYYFQQQGIPTEGCFSYKACDDNSEICCSTCSDDGDRCSNEVPCGDKCENPQKDSWKIVSYKAPELTREAIKKTIMENGPVEVGMAVYSDFKSYNGGIYQHTTEYILGYHAVTIVGWGNSDGIEYWIVKNSWGQSWGENGYFKILMGDSLIGSWFVYAAGQPIPPETIEVQCLDKDNDGYCNWGLGEKPANCPSNCKEIKDCDDSDSSIFEGCGKSTEKTGSLTINSEPEGADVYVFNEEAGNYIYRGKTPLTINLDIGEREIKITKEDYLDAITKVNIQEGQKTDLSVKLNLAPKLIDPYKYDIFGGNDEIEVYGTATYPGFKSYTLEHKEIEDDEWSTDGITLINEGKNPIIGGKLATWNIGSIKDVGFYTIRLSVNFADGQDYYTYINGILIDPTLKEGWPIRIRAVPQVQEDGIHITWPGMISPIISDLDSDGKKELVYTVQDLYPARSKLFISDLKGRNKRTISLPEKCSTDPRSLPSIGDVDNDGKNEIVVECSGEIESQIIIYGFDGSLKKQCISDGVSKDYYSTVVLEDLNLDSELEIIYGGWTYDWEDQSKMGSKLIVLDKNCNPLEGFPISLENIQFSSVNNPAVGNLDDDPHPEIVVISHENTGKEESNIRVFKADGTLLWSQKISLVIDNDPVIGDVDNDGKGEVIFTSDRGIHIINSEGEYMLNLILYDDDRISSPTALADLDKDGDLEIIFGLSLGYYVVNHDGSVIWSKFLDYNSNFPPVIGDINDESNIIIPSEKSIFSFNIKGEETSNFPKRLGANWYGLVSIDDESDILIGSSDTSNFWQDDSEEAIGHILAWDMNIGTSDWPQFQHDPQHTGCYDCAPAKPKSQILNTGTKTIIGRLIIKVEKRVGTSGLTQIKTIVDKQVSVSADGYLALDKEWAAAGYFTPTEAGEYRVYAALLNEQGIIETQEGKLEASYEFKVV